MKFSSSSALTALLSLPLFALAQTANTNATNGIGSLPAQRFEVSYAQVESIIKAATARASAINIPENVAVVNPSGLLVGFAHMVSPNSFNKSQIRH